MSTPYSSAQFHSYGPERRTDVYDMPTEPPCAHSPEPPYFDDLSEKGSNIGRHEHHPFDLPGERLPDAESGGHSTQDFESRQASFDQENRNNYYSNFSSSRTGSSTIWDNQNDKTGADSSGVVFDQYDYDVEEDNLLDPFSSKHTEELPTVQDNNGFSSADWSQHRRSESPVDHSASTLFSRTETQPSYDLGASRKDIPSNDSMPPTFDSDSASSDEEITTGLHVKPLRSHARGSDFSENKRVNRTSGKLVPDVNDSIEDFESRSWKQYQNPSGYNVIHQEQHSDGSPRSNYSGAQGNLGRVESRDYDLLEEDTEPHKLKGASSEITGANDNQPLSFGKQTSATSDDSDEGDLGLNFGRLTPGLRNKLRQPPPYKNSGETMLPKQSLDKAPASIEESVHSKENDTSFEQTGDTPKSSRRTKNSVGANYNSELYDRKQSVGKPVESRSSMTRNYFDSGDVGKLSERSGTVNPITTKSSVSANSSQELHHEKPGTGARRETRSRNVRTYFDSDDSEEELERRQQTKLSREQIQSRRTREVTSDTKRDGRIQTGARFADESESTPKETKTPAAAFSHLSTEQRREAPAYSRVPVQRSSPKPSHSELPTARGKWQEDELSGSSSPENEGNTETSAATPKENNSATAPAHVHPKLPTDYDSFAAHFMSLRTNRR
jgi:vacuolar protein sorting-associated protein IST1